MTRAPWARPGPAIGFAAASASGSVILAHALGWITLGFSLRILAPLILFTFVGLLAYAGRAREDVLMTRLLGGLAAGAAGLVAYNLLRLLIMVTGLVPFNPFRPIEVYGLLILDAAEDTALTRAVGWSFHLWNGLSFAMMYTLAVGKGRIAWAVVWGLLLELAMLSSYPSIFGLVIGWPFVVVSVAGHVAYGLALGVVAKRVVLW